MQSYTEPLLAKWGKRRQVWFDRAMTCVASHYRPASEVRFVEPWLSSAEPLTNKEIEMAVVIANDKMQNSGKCQIENGSIANRKPDPAPLVPLS